MRAVVMINDSYLSAEEFKSLKARLFYCLFTTKGLYGCDSSHFFFHPEALFEKRRWLRSLKQNGVTEVIFQGDIEIANDVSLELEKYGTASAIYFTQEPKPTCLD